uniref:Uncharacterized protein n=1 Tax=Salarias fasciatus TaxID=181472 RepID=A0A672FML7_SALFA
MEVVHVYTRLRRELGRHCLFSDRNAELLADVPPEPDRGLRFLQRGRRDQGPQACRGMSEHQVNTERFESESRGINHVEGGWPKDLNPGDLEQTLRFRKKVEKDESYVNSILQLGRVRPREAHRQQPVLAPDGGRRLATAYCCLQFQSGLDLNLDSYIWDVGEWDGPAGPGGPGGSTWTRPVPPGPGPL